MVAFTEMENIKKHISLWKFRGDFCLPLLNRTWGGSQTPGLPVRSVTGWWSGSGLHCLNREACKGLTELPAPKCYVGTVRSIPAPRTREDWRSQALVMITGKAQQTSAGRQLDPFWEDTVSAEARADHWWLTQDMPSTHPTDHTMPDTTSAPIPHPTPTGATRQNLGIM